MLVIEGAISLGLRTMPELKIFTDLRTSPGLMDWLREQLSPHELVESSSPASSVLGAPATDPKMKEADIILGQPSVSGLLESTKLQWAQITSAGYTRYDTPEFRAEALQKGLALTNSSRVYDQACAEHALAFMLAQARLLPLSLATRCANGTSEWTGIREGSRLLQGQSVIIYGYGAIAERLIALLAPFEMQITAVRRSARGNEVVPVVSPESATVALASVDHVINILPENPSSRGFFGVAAFSSMKPGAVFYNIGRGATVDQDVLADALENGHLAAAWLDVTDPEPLPAGHRLLSLENCHITPHVAGGQHQETRVLMEHFLQNFHRFLSGQKLVNRVI
jgi:phosphoglycerate dehydrogenase-like enzyme